MDHNTGALLETISSEPYESCEKAWQEILHLLHLKVLYIPAVQAILEQRRWRSQPNPIAYIRKAALRCAVRMGLVELPMQNGPIVLASDLNFRDLDGDPVPHDEKLDLAFANYEKRFGSYYDDGGDYSPSDIVSEDLLGDSYLVDWERAADLAGLDAGERIVLDVQLMGLGREQALAFCHTDKDRRLLQAAWKRFIRHRGALRATLLSGDSHHSRRIRRTEKEQVLELTFIELPDGSLRISFRKLVPEESV